MTEIKLQKHGRDVAVSVFGDSESEIEQRYWSFWNHGATRGELKWNHDRTNAYFWVSRKGKASGMDRLKKAMVNICLFEILNKDPNAFKGEKGGAMFAARDMAKEWLEGLDTCWAASKNSNVVIETHKAELPVEHSNKCDLKRILGQEYGKKSVEAY